jgi:ATP synthase delta (OSCP) subunit
MKPKFKLEDTVSSPQDLKSLTLEIREYAKWFAHNYIKKRVHARNISKEPELSPAASAVMRQWSAGKELTTKGLDELIATLEEYARSAPLLTITLAAVPPAGLKKTLVGWCRDNIAPNVLVNFQFNSTLLGGMVVRSGSRVFDWSFRRQILAERGRFPEVLRRV